MALLLIVDDNSSTLDLLEILFEKDGYQVIKADGGHGALALARKYKPQLILLDLMMPDMDGIAVCRAVRRDPSIRKTPIMMLTAARTTDKKQEILECGADEYVAKPANPAELREKVAKLLEKTSKAPAPKPPSNDQKVIAVIGTTGGSGTTTVAINLAASFAKADPDTILAELIPGSESVAWQLGLAADQQSASSYRQSFEDQFSKDSLTSIQKHTCGLDVLTLPQNGLASANEFDESGEQVQRIVQELSRSYRRIILDLGRGLNFRMQAALPYITDYVIVVRANSLALPYSIEQIKLLTQKGVSWNQIHIVLVSFGTQPYFLDLEKSKQVLQTGGIQNNVLMYLPAMRQLVYLANEQCMPMVMLYPEGQKLNRYFQEAIKRLSVEEKSA